MRSSQRGFTLLELSMVMVVIGLVIGGVVVGRSLIRNSETNAIIGEAQKYTAATITFKEKYKAWPGDMANATDYWGQVAAGCTTATGTGTQTCSGDGNNTIEMDHEMFRYWQHLANAGMIDGLYTGSPGAGGAFHALVTGIVDNANSPASKLPGTGYSLASGVNPVGDTSWFPSNYGHIFTFGSPWPNSYTIGPAITTEDAFKIDTKIDDGRPGLGKVMTYRNGSGFTPNCASSTVVDTATYNTNLTAVPAARGNACMLIFKTGF